MKKTRRGFFAALAGAVAAPLLLAKTAFAKSADPGYRVMDECVVGIDMGKGESYSVESVWASNAFPVSYELTLADVEKSCAEVNDMRDRIMFINPKYGMSNFYPASIRWSWPQNPKSWDFGNERTVTVIDPSGIAETIVINQGA